MVLGVANPRVALLNIGEEDTKGSAFAQEAHALMREKVPNFAGNGEGCDILPAAFDVFVTDGFTGNVCLKTIRGTSRDAFKASKGVAHGGGRATKLAGACRQGRPEGPHGCASAPTPTAARRFLGVKGACVVGTARRARWL